MELMEYAVNLADYTVLSEMDLPLVFLMRDVLGREAVEFGNKRIDDFGVKLVCSQERAEAIVAVARMRYPRRRGALRMYRREVGKSTWKRI